MGAGRSGLSGGGGGGSPVFPEAFAPGKDFEAVGGVNHNSRTVSRTTQAEWDQYASQFGDDVSSADEKSLMKQWNPSSNELYGYFRTTNSMALNAKFYQNPGKTPNEILDKRTRQGREDANTVDALDRAIASHKTPNDGTYYRFCNFDSLQRSYGFSDAEMTVIKQAGSMTPSELSRLNSSLRGSRASSPGYTSVSANRSLNAFSNPNAPQSRGYTIERRISVRSGTNAYAPKRNAQESEVVFGRNFSINLSHIAVEGNHIVVYEYH